MAKDRPSLDQEIPYRGRFAPSPTGPLHFGSLAAATASFLDARARQGEWLVRMEDLDPPREKPGAADDILRTLDSFGFEWDEPVLYQSHRHDAYAEATMALLDAELAYPCTCSRKQIAEIAPLGKEGPVYPGTCRTPANRQPSKPAAIRLQTQDEAISFHDRIQGDYRQNVASEVGDFVIRRADGLFAYQLAVVVDDGFQRISQIVRGADLLASTPRQIHLQRMLDSELPEYAHIPVVRDASGFKLSKSDAAHPVDPSRPLETLARVLRFLGQPVPVTGGLREFWREATDCWQIAQINGTVETGSVSPASQGDFNHE